MRYESLEEAGTLSVIYSGPPLDLFAIGVLQANLQIIIDKVVYRLSEEAGLVLPSQRPSHWSKLPPWQPPTRIVRGELKQITLGSLSEDVEFFLLAVLADPDLRDVLRGLAGNIVYAISRSGLKLIQGSAAKAANVRQGRWLRQRDAADIGPNIRALAVALAESVSHGRATIRFTSNVQGDEQECEITIDNRE